MDGNGIGGADDNSIDRRINYLGDIDGDRNRDFIMAVIYSAPEPYGVDRNNAGTTYVLFSDHICDN